MANLNGIALSGDAFPTQQPAILKLVDRSNDVGRAQGPALRNEIVNERILKAWPRNRPGPPAPGRRSGCFYRWQKPLPVGPAVDPGIDTGDRKSSVR